MGSRSLVRRWILVTALCMGAPCSRMVAAGDVGADDAAEILVPDAGFTLGMFTGVIGVTVFNADTDTAIGTIPIGTSYDCSVTADQTTGFVVDFNRNVWVIDLTSKPPRLAPGVNPIRISNNGEDTTISPDQRYLLVCDGSTPQPLSVLDIVQRQEIGTVPVDGDCSSVEACTDGSVLVTSYFDWKIKRFKIDSAGNLSATGDELGTGFYPVNSICSPKSSSGLVLALQSFTSFIVPGLLRVDSRPGGYASSGAINRAGDRVFLRGVNTVAAYGYDSTTGSLGEIPLFSITPNANADGFLGTDEIAVHPDGTKFYTLGSAPAITMNVYSTESGQLLRSIPTAGNVPRAVCFPSMECVPEAPLQCGDGDACTADSCDARGRCMHVPVVCDDNNGCTDDSCDPAFGCVYAPATGRPCSDGNACTTNDSCSATGQCFGGAPLNCNDNNSCTADSCDPALGCVNTPTPGASCSDGNACTTNDTCSATGQCVGGAPLVCNDNNPCTADTCDPASGCVFTPTPGVACSDNNACTVGDACNAAGQCVSGAPVICGALDQCHDAGVCDPTTGACSNPSKPDGTVCNDNDLCTTGDHCQAGVCTYTFSGLNEPNPHTTGWYKGLCQNPHSGDSLSDADAVCVGQITATFAGINTVAQICDVLMPSHPDSDACGKDEDQLMTLALNICKARVCTAQDIDSKCGSNANVGQSFSQSDGLFLNPNRSDPTCDQGACLDKEINNGSALEMNTLSLSVEGADVRLTWNPPYLNDGGGHPKSYNVYRRPAGSTVPFALIGNTAQATFLDTHTGSDSWEYNVTEVMN